MARTGRPSASSGWQNQIPGDVFTDEAVCDLDGDSRLLLIGMIGNADRTGRGPCKADELRVKCLRRLPIGDDQVAGMLTSMVELLEGSRYELMIYTVDRNHYYLFTRWAEWQPASKYTAVSKYPDPPVAEAAVALQDPPGALPKGDVPPGGTEGLQQGEGQGNADTQETHEAPDIWSSREYREFVEICEEDKLPWTSTTAFQQLLNGAHSIRGRQWNILIPVAQEAILNKKDKPPAVIYGLRIMQNLPTNLLTRAQVEEHFSHQREGTLPNARAQPNQHDPTAYRPKSSDEIA